MVRGDSLVRAIAGLMSRCEGQKQTSAHDVSICDTGVIGQSRTDIAAEKHLKLAQRYYVARVKELRELIAAEETKFKCVITLLKHAWCSHRSLRKLVTEIDEIRSGAWDDKIRVSVGIANEEPEMDVSEAQLDVVEADNAAEAVEEHPAASELIASEDVPAVSRSASRKWALSTLAHQDQEPEDAPPEPEVEQQDTAETEPTPEIEEKVCAC